MMPPAIALVLMWLSGALMAGAIVNFVYRRHQAKMILSLDGKPLTVLLMRTTLSNKPFIVDIGERPTDPATTDRTAT